MGVGERVGGGISTPVPSVIGHWGKEDTKLPDPLDSLHLPARGTVQNVAGRAVAAQNTAFSTSRVTPFSSKRLWLV